VNGFRSTPFGEAIIEGRWQPPVVRAHCLPSRHFKIQFRQKKAWGLVFRGRDRGVVQICRAAICLLIKGQVYADHGKQNLQSMWDGGLVGDWYLATCADHRLAKGAHNWRAFTNLSQKAHMGRN
jgi:hypothetical protein